MAVILVFSIQQSKPKAILPIIGGVLAGLVIEEMATMGIKWGMKTYGKKKADDIAAKIAADPNNKFDFEGMNPYLNKDGSLVITPSAMDRAKLASLIAGSIGTVAIESMLDNPQEKTVTAGNRSLKIVNGIPSDPKSACAYHFFNTNHTMKKSPESDPYNFESRFNFTPERYWTRHISMPEGTESIITISHNANQNTIAVHGGQWGMANGIPEMVAMYNKYIPMCGNVKTAEDGLFYPQTLNNVYNIDNSVTNTYILPNQKELENRPIIIYNVLPPSENEGSVTWGDIQAQFGSNEEFHAKIEAGVSHYLENGDLNTTTWNDAVINNYYTDIPYEKKKEEVEKEIAELVPLPNPGDNLPVPINPVEPINRGMLQVMTESYEFLADGVENSIQSMKTVTDKSMGLINYLDTAFRWLPPEWRAMFGAAFVLGVFAHFFRR